VYNLENPILIEEVEVPEQEPEEDGSEGIIN